jgi:hypothetical protein
MARRLSSHDGLREGIQCHPTTVGLTDANASPSWTVRKEGDPEGSPSPGQASSAGASGSLVSLDLSRNRNWKGPVTR